MTTKNEQIQTETEEQQTSKKEQSTMPNKESKSTSKILGSLADKMLNLTQVGAKKLEDYAAKSAEENDNKNALKLASVMKKFSQNLENNQEKYVEGVEKNAEELIRFGKKTFGSMKQVYKEMKIRAQTAKNKAEKDAEPQISDENDTPEEK